MGEAGAGDLGRGDVGIVITTHNALPWIEQCLASVEGVDTVVVDNDSRFWVRVLLLRFYR